MTTPTQTTNTYVCPKCLKDVRAVGFVAEVVTYQTYIPLGSKLVRVQRSKGRFEKTRCICGKRIYFTGAELRKAAA